MKTLIGKDDECPSYYWEPGVQIESVYPVIGQLRPVEVHVAPAGTVNDKPSFAFVLETPTGQYVAAQISLSKMEAAIKAARGARKLPPRSNKVKTDDPVVSQSVLDVLDAPSTREPMSPGDD